VSASDSGAVREGEQRGGSGGRHASTPPLVTLTAYYGAGGDFIGPRVADRLGVEFLDRGIRRDVAEQLHLSEEAAAEYDEQRETAHRLGRFFDRLARIPGPEGTALRIQDDERRYQAETEEFLARATTTGGVLLGRGGMVVLRSIPHVLHVMLGGPRVARLEQAMRLGNLDRRTAELHLEANDRARVDYITRRYGVDPEDPSLYHLRIDSTAVDLDTCVDIIVSAARSRAREATGTRDPRRLPEQG
jgi:cytidylate kinase